VNTRQGGWKTTNHRLESTERGERLGRIERDAQREGDKGTGWGTGVNKKKRGAGRDVGMTNRAVTSAAS
jgi:hypothetical protein